MFGEKGSRLAAESHTAAIDRTHPLPQVSWVVAAERLQSRIHGGKTAGFVSVALFSTEVEVRCQQRKKRESKLKRLFWLSVGCSTDVTEGRLRSEAKVSSPYLKRSSASQRRLRKWDMVTIMALL